MEGSYGLHVGQQFHKKTKRLQNCLLVRHTPFRFRLVMAFINIKLDCLCEKVPLHYQQWMTIYRT